MSILFVPKATAQEEQKKPKVALVLSGGGAWGFAHVPTLELLDSLNIVPDMIIGTSIGSIMGGLYASGYKGADIMKLAEQVEWKELLTGIGSMANVRVEEKLAYRHYNLELEIEDKKIKPITYVLNDQNLLKLFNQLIYPVHDIDDFDKLPIPFRAICTDLVEGKEIELSSGSLADAMRASLSIPGVFEPVIYGDKLLIDGGVYNNFPVDVARRMGADIVIGSDLGRVTFDNKSMKDIPSLITKVSMLHNSEKHAINVSDTDLLVNNSPFLTYGIGDFVKWREIYAQGKEAIKDKRIEFIELAEMLSQYENKSMDKPIQPQEFIVDDINLLNIDPANQDLVLSLLEIKTGEETNVNEIINGVDRVMGTTIFKNLYYGLKEVDEKKILQIKGKEKSPHLLKFSLHYDSYQGVGWNVNYTRRNILGNLSRTTMDLDIAVTPKLRFQHQQNIGKKLDVWWKFDLFGQLLTDDLHFYGKKIDNVRDNYLGTKLEFNKNIKFLSSYAGIGTYYNFYHLSSKLDPLINENILDFRTYDYQVLELFFHYNFNNLDAHYYPQSGSLFNIYGSISPFNHINFKPLGMPVNEEIDKTNNFSKVNIDWFKSLPINHNNTIHVGLTGAFLFFNDDDLTKGSFQNLGLGAKYRLGSNRQSPRRDTYTLPGLRFNEIYSNQFVKGSINFQYQFKPSFYLSPHADLAVIGYESIGDFASNFFNSSKSWAELEDNGNLISLGATLSYKSILGPIDFDATWINGINQVRFFLAVGYDFK